VLVLPPFQPLFAQSDQSCGRYSTKVKIPELKRLIMTQGQVVVMKKSMEETFDKMIERITAENEKVNSRLAPIDAKTRPQALHSETAQPVRQQTAQERNIGK